MVTSASGALTNVLSKSPTLGRGAIALALALSLPASLGATRDTLLAITFGVVLFTILVQSLTMDGVLRLYFGESNLPTPQYIKDAACQAWITGWSNDRISELIGVQYGSAPGRTANQVPAITLQGVSIDITNRLCVTERKTSWFP